MKHEYHLESFAIGKWLKILQGSLQYCQGFLDARKDYAPRNAYRLMRSDGRVMEEVPAREDVNIDKSQAGRVPNNTSRLQTRLSNVRSRYARGLTGKHSDTAQ